MTVSEMLKIPSLNGLSVVAGKSGLNNTVTTVSVMDAPDIYKWMKGGEFLITTAYPIREDVEYLKSLIENLHKAKVAAFGVKFSRFIGGVPQAAIETADRLGLPLVYIADEYAFTDIINPVLYAIVDQQAYELYQRENVHNTFLKNIVGHNDEDEILSILAKFVPLSMVFCDSVYSKLHFLAESEAFAGRMFKDLNANKFIGQSDYSKYDAVNGNDRYGVLYIENPENSHRFSSIETAAIDYALLLFECLVQAHIASSRIEERHRDEFLSDLILNNIKSENEIHTRAKLYNWDLSFGGVIVIVDVNNVKSLYLDSSIEIMENSLEAMIESISKICGRELSDHFGSVKYYKQSDFIVYLISLNYEERSGYEAELQKSFSSIRANLRERDLHTVTVCSGSYKERITDIHESYNEAHAVKTMASSMRLKDSIAFFDHMITFRLLASIPDQAVKREFLQRYVAPLIEYDRAHTTVLLQTVITSADCGWNDRAAAQSLYIHYNSIKYRLAKVEEVLGIDIRNHEDRFNLELALRLYQTNKSFPV